MAKLDFILQAVTTAKHADFIKSLLNIPNPKKVIVSVAFVRSTGLDVLEETIKNLPTKAEFFVGIRNDITSVQAIKRLLAMKVKLYAVDTGSRKRIFHPKLYFASSAKEASLVIGSANLTFNGLNNNIEASTYIRLSLADVEDKKFADETVKTFAEMAAKHTKHVFLIKNDKHAEELFNAGRLVDEGVVIAPSTSSRVKTGERDDLPPMKLNQVARPRVKTNPKLATPPKVATKKLKAKTPPPAGGVKYLVWESKALKERDLNVPTGTKTAPTGSMGCKKGAFENIDQRHYFRDEVFAELAWIADNPPSKWERSQAKFELVIKNLNYGVFNLKLSHNTDKNSASYKQNNFMTQIHWGDAKAYIAQRDLLGRTLYLYRKDTNPPEFMIEID